MTPEELNRALQSAALTYVREVKQQDVALLHRLAHLRHTDADKINRKIGPTVDRQSVSGPAVNNWRG